MNSSERFHQAAQAAHEAIAFINLHAKDEPKLSEVSDDLKLNLAKAVLQATSSAEVMQSDKRTIGVFGASQAGKSFLVSQMASQGERLTTQWDGMTIDYLNHVNPPGGNKEATGFVTRFTHSQDAGLPGFPAKVRVFNECDIAKILINSFYYDLDLQQVTVNLDTSYLLSHVQECLSKYKAPDTAASDSKEYVPSYEELVSLALYAQSHSNKNLQELGPLHPFWKAVYAAAPQLTAEGRAHLFSVLWHKTALFTMMYMTVVSALVKFRGQDYVYVPSSVFITFDEQKNTYLQRKGGGLLCVDALNDLFSESETVEVALNAEEKVSVPYAVLAAAAVELAFPLPEQSAVNSFDVLDFPGARSRKKDDLKVITQGDEQFDGHHPTPAMRQYGGDFMRRGKVAYLFDRYTQRQEVDVMFFCLGANTQPEVSDLTLIINDFIRENIGATPQDRMRFPYPPLIAVMTRFDELISREVAYLTNPARPLNTDTEERVKMVLEKIQAQEWMQEWTPGQPFNNFFVARATGWADEWMAKGPDGRETGIIPEKEQALHQVGMELLNDPRFTTHVRYPEECLRAVATPNDGGISVIARELSQHYMDKGSKEKRLQERTTQMLTPCVQELSRFVTLNGAKAAQAARDKGLKIALSLLQCDFLSSILGQLREFMELPADRYTTAYNDMFAAGSNARSFAKAVCKMYAENLRSLYSDERGNILCHKVLTAARLRRNYIVDDADPLKNFSFFYQEGSTQFKDETALSDSFRRLLQDLCDEMCKLFASSRLDLENKLIAALDTSENASTNREHLSDIQVRKARQFISDFNTSLGVTALTAAGEQVHELFALNEEQMMQYAGDAAAGKNAVQAFSFKPDMDIYLPKLSEATAQYDRRFWNDFFSALIYCMANININAGSEFSFNAADNALLCELVETMQKALQESAQEQA